MGKFIFGCVCALVFAIFIIVFNDAKDGSDIVKHGCAEYNSTTGDFQWIYKKVKE